MHDVEAAWRAGHGRNLWIADPQQQQHLPYTYTASNTAAIDAAAANAHPVDAFTYTVTDGQGGTTTETLDINIDRAPVVMLGGPPVFTIGGPPVQIAAASTVVDADGDTVSSLIVQVSGGYSGDGDEFSVGSAASPLGASGTVSVAGATGGFSYTYDASSETLTFTGPHAAADYQSLLQALYFDSANADPTNGGVNSSRTLAISATDSLSATGATASETISLAPAAPSIGLLVNHTGSGSASYTDHSLVELSGTAPASDTVTLYAGATAIGQGTAGTDGSFDIMASTALADGTYSLTAVASIGADAGPASPGFSVTVDTTAPALAVTSQTLAVDTGASNTDAITSDGQVTLSGTTTDGGTGVAGVEIYNGTTDLGAATISGGSWSFSTTLGEGSYALSATATDTAGNVASTAAQPTIIVDMTAPNVGAVTTTATGGVHAGDTVTFSVAASEVVVVSGAPELTLSNGAEAAYAGGSGTATLSFSYVVTGGQYTSDLHVTGLDTSAGSIADTAGNALSGGVADTDTGLSVDAAPPTVALTAASTVAIQGGTATPVLASDTISDADGGGTLIGATIAVANSVAGDVLILPGISGSSGTLDGGAVTVTGNGTASLTFTGADSLADYQILLAEALYQDSGTDTTTAGHASRVFDITVSNANLTSTVVDSTLEIDRAPVAPGQVIGVVAGATGTADASTGLLANATDADGDTLTIVAVNGDSGNVGMSVSGPDGAVIINADGSYSFTADASISAPTGSHPSITVPFTVSDGATTIDAGLTVTLDRPPITTATTALLSSTASLTTSTASGVLAADSDPDGDLITVTAITGGGVGATVSGTYGDLTLNADGSYTFTPGATSAEASALASYSGGRPADSFSFTVGDGDGGAMAQTLSFTIDRPPTATAGAGPASYSDGAAAAMVLPTATGADADGDALTSATVSITAGLLGGDVLAVDTSAFPNITASYDGTTGVLTLSGADSAADYQQVLDAVTFATPVETAADYGAPASRTLTIQLSDGDYASVPVSQTVNINVAFADTAANVASDFDSLNGDPSLVSITITDGQILALTAAQFTNDTMALAKITGAHEVVATGFTGGDYTALDDVFDGSGQLIDATYSGAAGQPYTSYTQVFDASGHLTSETFYGYTGQAYTTFSEAFDSQGRVTSQLYYDANGDIASGQPETSISYHSDGSYTANITEYDAQGNPTLTLSELENPDGTAVLTYGGVTGQPYSSYTQSYNANHTLTSETLSGYDVATYGYAAVTDGFNGSGQVTHQLYVDGSGDTVQTVDISYSSGGYTDTVHDYDGQGALTLTIVDQQNADGSGVVTYSGVSGQDFTGYSQSYDTTDHLTSETLSGYDVATYGYASVTDSFDSTGRLTTQTYEDGSGATVQTVALSYGTGGAYTLTTNEYGGQNTLTETIVDQQNADGSGVVTYSNISGQPYTGYSQTYDATNTLISERVFNTDGSETDYAFAQNQTIASQAANQIEYAIGGNDTFAINPNFGHDQIFNYTGGDDSFDISSSLFPDFASLIAAATDDGHGDTLITYDANDTFLIAGLTVAQLQTHHSDFHFV